MQAGPIPPFSFQCQALAFTAVPRGGEKGETAALWLSLFEAYCARRRKRRRKGGKRQGHRSKVTEDKVGLMYTDTHLFQITIITLGAIFCLLLQCAPKRQRHVNWRDKTVSRVSKNSVAMHAVPPVLVRE